MVAMVTTTATGKHNPANIFVVAEQFRFADKMLHLMLDGELQYQGQRVPFDVSAPMVTCAAFALELYLKCLISMETGKAPPNRHECDYLFGLLHIDTQAAIRKYFHKEGGATIAFIESEFAKLGRPAPKIDFDYVLHASRRSFPIARYLYEGLPGEQGWVAEMIMEGARAVILKRFPRWKEARQKNPPVIRTGSG